MNTEKLKFVVIDNDRKTNSSLANFYNDSPWAEITNTYQCPKRFLKSLPEIHFDCCIINLNLPVLDGVNVAKQIAGKPIIFVTDTYNNLKAALDICPLAIISKPIVKAQLDMALKRLHKLGKANYKKFELFTIAGSKGKRKILLSDILLVQSNKSDHRNKEVNMKGNVIHTFMDCTFERLLSYSPELIQINKSQLISITSFYKVESDIITIKKEDGKETELTLSRHYKARFYNRLSLI